VVDNRLGKLQVVGAHKYQQVFADIGARIQNVFAFVLLDNIKQNLLPFAHKQLTLTRTARCASASNSYLLEMQKYFISAGISLFPGNAKEWSARRYGWYNRRKVNIFIFSRRKSL
jgi:hypothetical protein